MNPVINTGFNLDVHLPKMGVKISLDESCCSNQSLRGEPHLVSKLTPFGTQLGVKT